MEYSIETIYNKVKEILQTLYNEEVDISMDTHLETEGDSFLDMSSLEIVNFIINIEKEFDIIIDFDDRYYTVGDVVYGVYKHLSEKQNNDL